MPVSRETNGRRFGDTSLRRRIGAEQDTIRLSQGETRSPRTPTNGYAVDSPKGEGGLIVDSCFT